MKNKNKHKEPTAEWLKKQEPKKHFPILTEEEYFYLYMTDYLLKLNVTIEHTKN